VTILSESLPSSEVAHADADKPLFASGSLTGTQTLSSPSDLRPSAQPPPRREQAQMTKSVGLTNRVVTNMVSLFYNNCNCPVIVSTFSASSGPMARHVFVGSP
jgi:hypothetical protein